MNWDKNCGLRYGLTSKNKHIYAYEHENIHQHAYFRFCPLAKIENSEISGSLLLLQILTVVVAQDFYKMNQDKI